MDFAGDVLNTMHQSVFYLRLALPGFGSGKAMDIAGWFHGVIFSSSSKS
jgi:hypothetical protein